MNANQRRGRIAAVTTSVLAVGAILGVGAFALSASAATPHAPTSTYSVPADEAEAARIEAERVAAEQAAAAAAQAEADRIAAEQAAAAQAEADRIAAEQAAAAQAEADRIAAEQAAAPAPAPAPAPAEPAQPGGDQQAGECREYNDANECTAYYTP